jgi:Domain of unknown function (DUF4340)
MRLRTTFLLFAIALAFGVLLFLQGRHSSRILVPGKQGSVLDIHRGEIDAIAITNGDVAIDLSKSGVSWRMTRPVTDRADSERINQLLSVTESLPIYAILADLGKGEKKRNLLKGFGLAKPRLRLKLQRGNSHSEMQFGSDSAVEGRCYARVEGEDPVIVVSADLKTLIANKVDYFRDRRLTPFSIDQIDGLLFRSPAGDIELQRTDESWQLARPIKARASQSAVADILTELQSTQVNSFQAQDRRIWAANEMPGRALTVRAGSSRVDLEFALTPSIDAHQVLLRISDRPGTVTVDSSIDRIFEIKPDDLRDRKIARLNPDLVDRITIEQAGQPTFVLQRRENRWRFLTKPDSVANSAQVNRLIETLNDQNVSAFVSDTAVDLTRYGLDTPSLRYTFSSYASENTAESNAGEQPLLTFVVGRGENGNSFAQVAEEPFVFSISQEILDRLPKTAADFATP